MTSDARYFAPLPVADFLQECLLKRLAPPAADWLAQQRSAIAHDHSGRALYMGFSAVPRHTGKSALDLDAEEGEAADSLLPGCKLRDWSVDQAARCLLLLAVDASDAGKHAAKLEALFSTADARELAALYSALPLLPHPERYRSRAAEGVRSNMLTVFHAIALGNPYPYRWFDEAAWNQMVLKVAFLGSPLSEVVGLQERRNPALARMLRDLVHERWAAGRSFPPALWDLMAPHADAGILEDMQRALDDADASQRAAAARALASLGEVREGPGTAARSAHRDGG